MVKVNQDLRIRKTKQKFGTNCYVHWGLKGGSPILLAYAKRKRNR